MNDNLAQSGLRVNRVIIALNCAFLVDGELFAQEEILRRKRGPGSQTDGPESTANRPQGSAQAGRIS
jgi:hypothetical protein